MKLDKRELELLQPPQTGPDVVLLHDALSMLGDDFRKLVRQDIDASTGQHRFDRKTQAAVAIHQRVNEDRLKAIVATSLDGASRVRWSGRWGVVDPATAQLITEQVDRQGDDIVRGRVEFEDGTPAAGMRVVVRDRDIGADSQRLSPAQVNPTNASGEFPEVRYRTSMYASGEGGVGRSADLVFEVTSDDARRPVELIEVHRQVDSPKGAREERVDDLVLGFPALHEQSVRLVVRHLDHVLPSEYERLMAALQPLLRRSRTPDTFDEATHRDLTFAARETGEDKALIGTVAQAWTLSRAVDLPPESFYGLLRDGPPTTVRAMPPELADMLPLGPSAWRAKLDEAIALRLIPSSATANLAAWMDRLQALRVDAALHAAADAHTASVDDVLASAGLPAHDRKAFAALRIDYDGPRDTFWKTVADGLKWSTARIDSVQAALRLAEVVSAHKPLLNALFAKDPALTARKLASWERRDLDDLVAKTGAPAAYTDASPTARQAAYVDDIESSLRVDFPAAYVVKVLPAIADHDLRSAGDWLKRLLSSTAAPTAGAPRSIS